MRRLSFKLMTGLRLRNLLGLAWWTQFQMQQLSPSSVRGFGMLASSKSCLNCSTNIYAPSEPPPFSRTVFRELLLHWPHENQWSQWMPRLCHAVTAMNKSRGYWFLLKGKPFLCKSSSTAWLASKHPFSLVAVISHWSRRSTTCWSWLAKYKWTRWTNQTPPGGSALRPTGPLGKAS